MQASVQGNYDRLLIQWVSLDLQLAHLIQVESGVKHPGQVQQVLGSPVVHGALKQSMGDCFSNLIRTQRTERRGVP